MRLLSCVALGIIGYARADHPEDPMHQLDPHAEFLDSTVIDSVSGIITSTVMLGSEVRCEAAHDLGTAAHYYTDFVSTGGLISPPDALQFSKDSILAYKCGVVDSVTGDSLLFQHPPLPATHQAAAVRGQPGPGLCGTGGGVPHLGPEHPLL